MQSMIKCNKFIPQAFNNNKCQNCFIYKDNHTAEALFEYSKVSRKLNILFCFVVKKTR